MGCGGMVRGMVQINGGIMWSVIHHDRMVARWFTMKDALICAEVMREDGIRGVRIEFKENETGEEGWV